MISTYLQCERSEAATFTKFNTAKRSYSRWQRVFVLVVIY